MSIPVFMLLVLAAFTHAFWNLLAKKVAMVGPAFVVAYTSCGILFYTPLAVWVWNRFGFPLTPLSVLCVVASAILHLVYSIFLQRGYQFADLSIVYPVARGIGPLLSAVGAVVFFGEVVSAISFFGLLFVVGGIFVLAGGTDLSKYSNRSAKLGIFWGGATGTMIAGYTVVDGWGAKVLGINPVLLNWFGNIVRLIMLIPTFWHDRIGFRHSMHGYWSLAFTVGALAPLSYMLVLCALQIGAPLHIVAPAREISMMLVTLMGMAVLGEAVSLRQIFGCTLMFLGVLGLSL